MNSIFVCNVIICNQSVIVQNGVDFLIQSNFIGVKTIFVANRNELFSLLDSNEIDVLILDINSHSRTSLLRFLTRLKSNYHFVKILIISNSTDPSFVLKLYQYGVDCYLSDDCKERDFISVFRKLLSCNISIDNQRNKINTSVEYNLSDIKKLSKREMQVALLLIKGKSNLEITKELNLSIQTVSTYKRRVMVKTESKNIVELVNFFAKREKRG